LIKVLPYSTVVRLFVEFSHSNHSIPRDIFLKSTPGSINDPYAKGIGKSEVEFYKKVAPEISCPPLVQCFEAVYDSETDHSHILMEDLSATHSQPDQGRAPFETESVMAVETLAKAHAVYWNDPRLGKEIGKLFDQNTLNKFIENVEQSVLVFLESSGIDLTATQRQAYQLMLRNADKIWGRLIDPTNLTVTHGDCHWWNFLYPKDLDSETVRIFDWHLWHIDLGARDLAFLLALGGFAEPRPEREDHLLKSYHSTLVSNGVSNYTYDQLYADYRWCAIRNLNIPAIFWSQGKHESTWQTAFSRATESFERLRCSELLLDR